MPITTTTTTTTISDSVIELYTTLLGRAADTGGLKFWTDAFASLANAAPITIADKNTYALKVLAANFSDSAEHKQKLIINNHSGHAGEIRYAFKNAFNTDADDATVQTYVSKITAGTATIADINLEILNSAKALPTAKAHLDNKTAFSNYFITISQTITKFIDVSFQFKTITHDPKTVETAKAETDIVMKDNMPPMFSKATVQDKTLVINYTDESPLSLNSSPKTAFLVHANKMVVEVTDAKVDATAKTITLTLKDAVTKADVVDVSYFAPPTDSSAEKPAVQDQAGNDAPFLNQQMVVNNTSTTVTPPVTTTDTMPPVFKTATVNDKSVVLVYDDANPLNTATADKSAFAVTVGTTANPVTNVAVDGGAKTVTLTLTNPVLKTDMVKLAYTDPTTGNDANAIQDLAGNDASSLPAQDIANITAGTAPVPPTAPPPPANAITGTSGVDTLTGTSNADSIIGAGSGDKLTGGASADTFVYKAMTATELMGEVGATLSTNATTAPSLTGIETITDFISGSDKIQLSVGLANSVNGSNSNAYTATTIGLLTTDFVTTTTTGLAADAGNARFYVNTANNVLYFDKTGDTVIDANNTYTAGAADDFAVLQLTGQLQATDFVFA